MECKSKIDSQIMFIKNSIEEEKRNQEDRINSLLEKLAKAEEIKSRLESLSQQQKLAILIHDKMIYIDINEDPTLCLWEYIYSDIDNDFIHDWNEKEHVEYLDRAQQILKIVSYDDAVKILEIL